MKHMKFDYDCENDSLFLFQDEGVYEFSEFLTNSIAIDFNTDKIPIGIEVFNASKKFNTEKNNLLNIINGIVKVSICEKEIKFSINLNIKIHSKSTSIKPVSIVKDNNFNIPDSETNRAIT